MRHDHVVVGRVPGSLTVTPDPAEVAATMWVDPADLDPAGPDYAPWLAGVLPIAVAATRIQPPRTSPPTRQPPTRQT